jgi:hypothetical protein
MKFDDRNASNWVFQGSIFNLGESEPLTHRGKVLGEAATLVDDPRSDDDEDDTGKLIFLLLSTTA